MNVLGREKIDRIYELADAGLCTREIAQIAGVNRETVRSYVGPMDQSAGLRRMHVRLKEEGRPMLPPWRRSSSAASSGREMSGPSEILSPAQADPADEGELVRTLDLWSAFYRRFFRDISPEDRATSLRRVIAVLEEEIDRILVIERQRDRPPVEAPPAVPRERPIFQSVDRLTLGTIVQQTLAKFPGGARPAEIVAEARKTHPYARPIAISNMLFALAREGSTVVRRGSIGDSVYHLATVAEKEPDQSDRERLDLACETLVLRTIVEFPHGAVMSKVVRRARAIDATFAYNALASAVWRLCREGRGVSHKTEDGHAVYSPANDPIPEVAIAAEPDVVRSDVPVAGSILPEPESLVIDAGDDRVYSAGDVEDEDLVRVSTGSVAFDRYLGGGAVLGFTYLFAGRPGYGKTTRCVDAAACIAAQQDWIVLYVCGEEPKEDVKRVLRKSGVFDRYPSALDRFRLYETTDPDKAIAMADHIGAKAIVVDSLSVMRSKNATSGKVAQFTYAAKVFSRRSQAMPPHRGMEKIVVFGIGHVNQDGSMSGPNEAVHMVSFAGIVDPVDPITLEDSPRPTGTIRWSVYEGKSRGSSCLLTAYFDRHRETGLVTERYDPSNKVTT